MQVVYALEDPPSTFARSLFLAGPTPRRQQVSSWRPQALVELAALGYDGVVFVPEDRSGVFHGDYDGQIAWEERCLEMADCVVFWVPRDLADLPALTTNTEFGRWYRSGKMAFGGPHPDKAHKNAYLRHYAIDQHAPHADTLTGTLQAAVELIGPGAPRSGGERDVPLQVWRTSAFQSWYAALRAAGNRLDGARVEWVFRVGARRQVVFCWALHVNVWVADEQRHKSNEFVLSRPDISSVLLYRRRPALEDCEVVLVREFRAPVRSDDGYVRELPGGSSPTSTQADQVALEELHEEAGVDLDPARLLAHGSRQLAATLSAHHGHLFSCSLSDDEIEQLRGRAGQMHGAPGSSERTYLEVVSVAEIRRRRLLDWSTLGMILDALTAP